MIDPTGPSNVVWLDRRLRPKARYHVADLEVGLACGRHMLATLRLDGADLGDLERCVELTEAMLAIARG